MGLKKLFFANTRKPKGILGKIMINRMNKGHANLSDWGLAVLLNGIPELHHVDGNKGCCFGSEAAAA